MSKKKTSDYAIEEAVIEEDVIDPIDDSENTIEDVPVEVEEVSFGTSIPRILNFRETPSEMGKIIMLLHSGTEMIIDLAFVDPVWYKVKINDREGYVMKKFVKER